MNPPALTALLLFLGSAATSYANETESSSEDIRAYCQQQAEMAGIENTDEMKQYLNDCINSFTIPSQDYQQAGE